MREGYDDSGLGSESFPRRQGDRGNLRLAIRDTLGTTWEFYSPEDVPEEQINNSGRGLTGPKVGETIYLRIAFTQPVSTY